MRDLKHQLPAKRAPSPVRRLSGLPLIHAPLDANGHAGILRPAHA